MCQLNAEQMNNLFCEINHRVESGGSRANFAETVLALLEDISGFESISRHDADELIQILWEMTMSKNEAAAVSAANQNLPTEADKINLNTPLLKEAIIEGKKLISEGNTKADAARAMYSKISAESKETIIAAFVDGAALTPKGAQTYWYNCKRRASKEKKAA